MNEYRGIVDSCFLRNTDMSDFIVRSTRVKGGWDDVESYAKSAGFKVYRFISEELVAKHEFAECYHFIRK